MKYKMPRVRAHERLAKQCAKARTSGPMRFRCSRFLRPQAAASAWGKQPSQGKSEWTAAVKGGRGGRGWFNDRATVENVTDHLLGTLRGAEKGGRWQTAVEAFDRLEYQHEAAAYWASTKWAPPADGSKARKPAASPYRYDRPCDFEGCRGVARHGLLMSEREIENPAKIEGELFRFFHHRFCLQHAVKGVTQVQHRLGGSFPLFPCGHGDQVCRPVISDPEICEYVHWDSGSPRPCHKLAAKENRLCQGCFKKKADELRGGQGNSVAAQLTNAVDAGRGRMASCFGSGKADQTLHQGVKLADSSLDSFVEAMARAKPPQDLERFKTTLKGALSKGVPKEPSGGFAGEGGVEGLKVIVFAQSAGLISFAKALENAVSKLHLDPQSLRGKLESLSASLAAKCGVELGLVTTLVGYLGQATPQADGEFDPWRFASQLASADRFWKLPGDRRRPAPASS